MNPKTIAKLPTISSMLLNGARLEEIATETGLSFGTIVNVRRAIREGKPFIRKTVVRKSAFNTTTRKLAPKVAALKQIGCNYSEISRRTGLTVNTIKKVLSCN